MKRFGNIVVVVGGFAWVAANLHGQTTLSGTTNKLNSSIAGAPPKITLTGIATGSGTAKALFKVAGTGEDGKDGFYISKEGQEHAGVAVVTIDVNKKTVTFLNHGLTQNLILANTSSSEQPKKIVPDVMAPDFQYPKPGDSNYADPRVVTAPLPKNKMPKLDDPDEGGDLVDPDLPTSMQSISLKNGGSGYPPGHGGS